MRVGSVPASRTALDFLTPCCMIKYCCYSLFEKKGILCQLDVVEICETEKKLTHGKARIGAALQNLSVKLTHHFPDRTGSDRASSTAGHVKSTALTQCGSLAVRVFSASFFSYHYFYLVHLEENFQ